MDVSIIIINYNTENLILNCVESIYKNTKDIEFEILVVDNASPKKPLILPIDKRIKFIQSSDNLGFGRANNLGAQHAQGKFLFLLNPDTVLLNNAVNVLYDYISQRDSVGACGPNLYTEELTSNLSFSVLNTGIWQEFVDSRGFTKRKFNKTFNDTNRSMSVPFVSGAALMVRKKVFYEVGGFSRRFFMYYEDNDLCLSIIRKGFKIVNLPSAKIIHLDGKSFTFKQEREILSLRGRKIYYIKNYGSLYFYLSCIIFTINNGLNLLWFLLRKRKDLTDVYWFKIKNVWCCHY